MLHEEPVEREFNTVSAEFARPADAEAALARLARLGVRGTSATTESGGVLLTFNAGEQEEAARAIVAECGGRPRGLPG